MLYLCTTRTRQASQRCSNVRVVLFYTMNNRIPFQKPYTSARDLVCLLQSRGLTVTDPAKAERYLEFIGYMKAKLSALLSAFPSIDGNAMGFPHGWENEPLWE